MMSAVVAAGCQPWELSCLVKEGAASAFEAVVDAMGEAVITMISFLSTFWLSVPSPTVARGSGSSWTLTSTVGTVQSWIGPATAAIAVLSFTVAIARIAFTGQAGESRHLLRQVAAVGAGTLGVAAATQLLIAGGDLFSPWIIDQASAGGPSEGLKQLLSAGFKSGNPTGQLGLWFIVFILAALGSLAQCVFMFVRGAALMVLMVFVAPTAAGAASEEGWTRFKRLAFLIIGFALYKPVAAIIYAVGIMEMSKQSGAGGDADIKNALYGLTIMVMAALALPAFIKFLMPMAAMGSSNAFSGAAAAGVMAAGAAVVATGGFGAAGAGAGAAGGSGSAGAAATKGAGAVPPPPSGGDGGGGGGGASSSSRGGGRAAGAMAASVQDGSSRVATADPDEGP